MPTKAWVEAHQEHLRAYRREWMRKNRDKVKGHVVTMKAKDPEAWAEKQREKMAKWRQENPEKAKGKARQHYYARRKNNPEGVRKNQRDAMARWIENNPDGKQMHEETRRARKRQAPGSGVSQKQWRAIKDNYGRRCAYCAAMVPLTMDHLDPLSKGGAHDPTNIVPACRNCNSQKHDNTVLMWLAKRAA